MIPMYIKDIINILGGWRVSFGYLLKDQGVHLISFTKNIINIMLVIMVNKWY